MNVNIECPNCRCDVPVTEVLQNQMETKVRQEMQASLAAERNDLEKRQAELSKARKELEHSSQQLEERVKQALEAERKQLAEQMLVKARESVRLELADRDEELTQLRKELKETHEMELELRRRERQLNEKSERLELEVERKLDAERKKILSEAMLKADEQYQLKSAEKDKTISDMRKQIDALRRKSELTSQQLQGEVQEIALEEKLKNAFPLDSIDPVGKGRNGADVGQLVCDPTGQHAGKIVWESKRTKNWNDAWLPKVRDDLREAGADIAVIVSETLPEGISTIGCIEGVWICRWDCLVGLAAALRSGLIEVAKAAQASEGKGTKIELLYDYFAGTGFRNRVSGIIEAVHALQQDLVKEKAAMHRLWGKREKQHERTIINISGLYGDFQGIVGEAVPALESFNPLRLGSSDALQE